MPSSLVLSIKRATKAFNGRTAVDGLKLDVRHGEIVGLIGPNGSGKTTTLKMIAGIYRPTEGTITVAGADVTSRPTAAKRHLGLVPDDPSGYDMLTGRELLMFTGELFGMERAARDAKIEELIAAYRIEPVADTLLAHCSRGTRQKFALIAGLLHSPSLLLVDEPMVGLDPEAIRVTVGLFKAHAAGGGAILLSTHTLAVADEICQRFVVLKGGKVLAQGTHATLSEKADRMGTLEDIYLSLIGGL